MNDRHAIASIRAKRILALPVAAILFATAAFGVANASPSPGFQGNWTCKYTTGGTLSIAIRGNSVTARGPGGYRITGPLEGAGKTASVQYTTARWADRFELTNDGKLNVSGSHRVRGCTK